MSLGHTWPLPDDADWRREAACRGQDPMVFFPGRGDTRGLARALAFCARCTVRDACLADALTITAHDDLGVRGGYSQRARRNMTRNVPLGTAANVCGTNAGYYRHHRKDERACEACTEAHRAYNRSLKVAKRAES